ncbi:hypothetical protein BLS_004768 [Venturia inaequalis]|uniref:Bud emergence protein 1 n=1 Tax=Venturia inaequalis TaxID=5025 RepID=A0A8H3UN51_VENIN|nr:hypothetical protein BLS_004768 [Venturia inaequalis]KAE9973621.1 hypothetical protein EG328_004292 [Venturia inaequalis]KAE9981931.1 hypothetical protein EG327_006045 [Venturia inaequalis]RDI78688.1 Cuticle-degrading protease [Venturia inaequalis]
MVKFRMSMKSDKVDSKNHHSVISIPQKDAIAIIPPKKVIKAIYNYHAPNRASSDGYLSFNEGDFLHVVGRENDADWYEACNPLQGTRGLVPVKYFEIVGKQARNSAGSTGSGGGYQPVGAHHDSGYADSTTTTIAGQANIQGQRLSKSSMTRGGIPGQGQGAMVYGVVMYDFKAERPDELEAKEGEAIIVIAQSNPEWFVAKPITRLGGPGLIPVSFIEIRDMTTGQSVPDPLKAVQDAGVPKVEEWKRMAADYKNGSIPLGKLDANAAHQAGLANGMARLSVDNASQATHGSQATAYSSQSQRGPYSSAYPTINAVTPSRLLAPLKASVPRYCFADEIFWFIVECQMEDGRHWELQRLYQDFYDLQINLIQEHPLEAGNVKGVERSLPYMPGPVTYVTDNISNGRRANLDEYIRNLLKLGPHITRGGLVRAFFSPREGDYEIDPNQPQDYRLSGGSQGSQQNSNSATSPQSSADALPRQQPSQLGHYRTNSQATTTTLGPRGPNGTAAAMKIKVWFEGDNCVVIRMPPPGQFSFAELYKKLKERRALEGLPDSNDDVELGVFFRDENAGQLVPIRNDQELQGCLERGERFTLSVTVR